MSRSESTINTIKVSLPDHDFIEVYAVSDLHWEDPQTNEKLFYEFIDYILEQPYRYVVLNGDLLNMALTMSVSDTYGEKYAPEDAVIRLAKVLEPLKERILAIGTGNHEDRVYKHTGLDVTRYLVKELAFPVDRYSPNSFMLFISFGRSESSRKQKIKHNVYSMFFHHGVGGGRTKGAKANMVVRMSDIAIADIYVVGHVHDPLITPSAIFMPNYQSSTMSLHKMYYMISNAWQNYGGYAQKFAFAPPITDMSYVTLNGIGSKKIKMHIGI